MRASNPTFKYINGSDYLYLSYYNVEKTKAKREELKAKGYSYREIRLKGSVYDYVSQGKWDLDNPSEKLRSFLQDKSDEYINELDKKVKERQRKRVEKKSNNVKEKTLQKSG